MQIPENARKSMVIDTTVVSVGGNCYWT